MISRTQYAALRNSTSTVQASTTAATCTLARDNFSSTSAPHCSASCVSQHSKCIGMLPSAPCFLSAITPTSNIQIQMEEIIIRKQKVQSFFFFVPRRYPFVAGVRWRSHIYRQRARRKKRQRRVHVALENVCVSIEACLWPRECLWILRRNQASRATPNPS